MNQFFGKHFKASLLLAVILYALAFMAYRWDMGQGMILGLMVASTFVAYKRPERALFLPFLELFINPHGVLISTNLGGFDLSLRMAIFIGVMLGWGITLVQRKVHLSKTQLEEHSGFFLIILAAALGVTVGVFSRDPGLVFADGNAYLYLLYILPIITIEWTATLRRELLQTLAAGAIFIGTLSLALLYVFSHFDASLLTPTYEFFRDLRVAEITILDGGLYRIFIQSQVFVIMLGLMALSMVGYLKDRRLLMGLGGLAFSMTLLSLSRSFWVGLAPAVLYVLWTLWRAHHPSKQVTARYIGYMALTKLLAVLALVSVVLFPFPSQDLTGSSLVDSLKDRTTEEDVAISSRWNLLWPMATAILNDPLIGNGFGSTVTFITDDPRARAINPDGQWTTHAMEWGWLELWLKMGIVGPLAFLFLGWQLASRLQAYRWTEQAWLGVSLTSILIFLFATHLFSPYLNHPIGLGTLLFIVPFLPTKNPSTARVEEFVPIKVHKGKVSRALASRQ